jgi:cytochrome c556
MNINRYGKIMNKVLVAVLALYCVQAIANEYDQRQVISLTEPQQAHVLKEMRSMLAGTQAILVALSTDNLEAVIQHARSLGMSMKKKPENVLHNVLPEAFMQMGKAVHTQFDVIANDAATLKDSKHTLKQLGAALQQCNNCHEIYRIEAVPQVQRGKNHP